MRIIAGKYRGRNLFTLEGLQTRPTLDGTKEAIFSSLGGYIPNFVTLDLFGGSGALSIESLSRGACKTYITDASIDAVKIIKKNAETLKIGNELVVYNTDYKEFLKKMKNNKFDIIFIDPPFRMKVIDEIITFITSNDMIADNGFIVAEYPKEDVVSKIYEGYHVKLCRRYSSSEILILEKE
jgi:16S rRNA (guanine966-N2)-methyltransferase